MPSAATAMRPVTLRVDEPVATFASAPVSYDDDVDARVRSGHGFAGHF